MDIYQNPLQLIIVIRNYILNFLHLLSDRKNYNATQKSSDLKLFISGIKYVYTVF